jgi:FkbM family methyltransferase
MERLMFNNEKHVRLTAVGSTQFLTNPNDTLIGKSLEVYGEWSHGEIDLLSKLLKPDSNVVEIGANIGAHTVFIARDICPAGKVYAFEPRRLSFQMLCANVALNGLTNVFAFQKAVGKEAASIREGPELTKTTTNFGGFAIGALKGKDEIIVIEPLDQMIDFLKQIALLKADVEGWERDVLIGSQKVIARDRPILYVENDRVDRSRDLITSIMEMNYNLWWHIVPLFRPNNHAHTPQNIFGSIHSFNMLCLPRERAMKVTDMPKIEDAEFHPVQNKARNKAPTSTPE